MGKEYTPMMVEKELLNFCVFDVLHNEKYLILNDLNLPHSVEFIEIKKYEDIDKYKVLNWPKNKEGIMVKIYDEKFELDYKEARNFNMMAFKYKPLIRLIEEELKNRKIKIDHRLLAIVISELITEYAKNKELSFYEMLDNVKKDHIELKNFIEINVDLIKILWNESLIVKSIL